MSLATEFRVEMRMPINPTAKEYADVTEGSLSRTAEAARAQHRLHRIGQQDAVWVDPKAANRTAGFATATLVLGIVSFFFSPVAIVAFITAHFATRNGQHVRQDLFALGLQ